MSDEEIDLVVDHCAHNEILDKSREDCLTSSQSCQTCQEFTTIQCRIRTMITIALVISVVYRGLFVLHSFDLFFLVVDVVVVCSLRKKSRIDDIF